MAGRGESSGFLSQLEGVRGEVREKFSRAHQLLQERESALLQQLQEIELNYRDREARNEKQRKELLATKEQIQSTMRGNENQKTLQAMLAPLDASLRELQLGDGRIERMGLEWDGELENKLRDAGKILQDGKDETITTPVPSKYQSRGTALRVACKQTEISKLDGEFRSANTIIIDSNTENIYICDELNNRIQVFNKSCIFIFSFSENMMCPVGIAIHDYKVYTTQYGSHTLCVYTTAGAYLETTVGSKGDEELQFNSPLGMCIDSHRNLIYVCEGGNKRVQVLDLLTLKFHSFITGLLIPKDIKLANGEIFVLDRSNPCIHVYNGNHQVLRELISYGDTTSQIIKSYHFVIDQNSNFLFTDHSAKCVSIFTKEGNLLHKFGREGAGIGEFIKPKGIAIDSDGCIIVASANPSHCIQFF